jgi:lipopolysaccharide/colanic/teichoic acid biosynthesis glycosyltransferase
MIRLFQVSLPSSVVARIASEMVLILSCYVLAAYWTLEVAADIFLIDDGGIWRISLVAAVIVIGLYFNGFYTDYRTRSRMRVMEQLCVALGVALVLQALLTYGEWRVLVLPKWPMLYGSLMVLLVLPPWHILFSMVVSRAIGAQRLLFLGSPLVVRDVIEQMVERAELGLTPIGYLDSNADAPPELWGAPYLGPIEQLDSIVAARHPDRIVIGMTRDYQRLPMERLLELQDSDIEVEEATTTYEAIFRRVSAPDLLPSQLILSAEFGPRPLILRLQSWYSRLFSLVAIVVTLPVMAVVALVIKITSPGSIVLRQRRAGLGGVPFTLFKFRCEQPTVAGRWMRKLHLDSLPQLFNVLRDEMSIVGPQAERPEFIPFLEEQIPYYRQRHCVKPGLTGWAQINQQYSETLEDTIVKLEYDLYYIKNMALTLDAYIVLHTVKLMLVGR